MPDDARETGKTATAPTKKRTYTPTPPPTPSANEYARVPPATVTDAVRTIALEDFTAVHTQPCVRNSLMYGIGTGFAFGGLRLVLGGVSNYLATFSPPTNLRAAPVPKAANWAAGTFAGASLVTYEFCQYRRSREKVGMQRAIEIIDRRKVERDLQMQEKREKREQMRKELEERAAAEAAARRSWYRFW